MTKALQVIASTDAEEASSGLGISRNEGWRSEVHRPPHEDERVLGSRIEAASEPHSDSLYVGTGGVRP